MGVILDSSGRWRSYLLLWGLPPTPQSPKLFPQSPPWQSRVHSPCQTGSTTGNRNWHTRKFFEVSYFVFKRKIIQLYAFCVIKLLLREAGPCFFPVALCALSIPQVDPCSIWEGVCPMQASLLTLPAYTTRVRIPGLILWISKHIGRNNTFLCHLDNGFACLK